VPFVVQPDLTLRLLLPTAGGRGEATTPLQERGLRNIPGRVPLRRGWGIQEPRSPPHPTPTPTPAQLLLQKCVVESGSLLLLLLPLPPPPSYRLRPVTPCHLWLMMPPSPREAAAPTAALAPAAAAAAAAAAGERRRRVLASGAEAGSQEGG